MSDYKDAYDELMIVYNNVVPAYKNIAYKENDTEMISAYMCIDWRRELCQLYCTDELVRYKGQRRDAERALQAIERLDTPEANIVKKQLKELLNAIEKAKNSSPKADNIGSNGNFEQRKKIRI